MKLIKVNESLINNPNLAAYVERTDFRDKDEIQELAKEHNVKIVDFGEDNKSLKAEGKFDDIISFYKRLNLIPDSPKEEDEEVKTETEEETFSESLEENFTTDSKEQPITEAWDFDNLTADEEAELQLFLKNIGGGSKDILKKKLRLCSKDNSSEVSIGINQFNDSQLKELCNKYGYTLIESLDNEPLTENYLDNLKNPEYWQHQVDYQIEKFGRVGGGLIQDLDEAGFYLDKDNKVTSKVGIKEDCLTEDTIKQGNKWVNKGKDGTHGEFKTKKAAEAQRKAMFANGFGESLTEDVDSSEEKKDEESLDPPEAGDPIGVANLLNMLIKSEWDAIEDYNSAIQTLTGMNFDETILNIIKDIVGEEHVHIGQLQKALETVSPNAVNIQEGEKEATEQLQEPVYTKEEGQEVTPEGIVKSDTEENQK